EPINCTRPRWRNQSGAGHSRSAVRGRSGRFPPARPAGCRERLTMEQERNTILVVDDDREMANILVEILSSAGYRAIAANSGTDAIATVRREHPDLVISDLRMVGMSGHQLQAEIKRVAPNLPVVIITAFGSIQTAVESMKLGAFDYITKPF